MADLEARVAIECQFLDFRGNLCRNGFVARHGRVLRFQVDFRCGISSSRRLYKPLERKTMVDGLPRASSFVKVDLFNCG